MKELLGKGTTLIVLGPGGVGKTTVAAALGVAAAVRHLETGVVTVDPARRLRDALGLELSARPSRLDARRLRAAGMDPSLKLWAMVLDVKRTWDGLVARFVKTPAARRQILANSFYQSLTERFAGAEAYAALEQLYDLHEAARFEMEIVDTPPASHAFEFIEAPAHLIRLLDSHAAQWLFTPHPNRALSLAGRAARFVVRELERFAGVRTLTAISEFFSAAAGAVNEIVARLHKTDALLHSPDVHFVLVTTAEEDRLREASDLREQMENQGLRLGAIVLNRLVSEATFDALRAAPRRIPAHLEEIASLRSRFGAGAPSGLGALIGYLEEYARQEKSAVMRAAAFAEQLPPRVRLVIAPEIAPGVRDLRTLAKLGTILTEIDTGQRFLAAASNALCDSEERSSQISAAGHPLSAGSSLQRHH
ncbi:MAG: ArsA family ATPase [Candidatus Binataceae bacterium]